MQTFLQPVAMQKLQRMLTPTAQRPLQDQDEPPAVSDEAWAASMGRAFAHPQFVALLEQCVKIAHQQFWKSDPVQALVFGHNTRPPADDPLALAITQAHHRLAADPSNPRWLTLALFCVARMIAVNAKKGFDSDQWTDFTLLFFDLEKRLLNGDGLNLARGIVQANDRFFDGQLPQLIGGRMLHGLAEAAINAPRSRMFQWPEPS